MVMNATIVVATWLGLCQAYHGNHCHGNDDSYYCYYYYFFICSYSNKNQNELNFCLNLKTRVGGCFAFAYLPLAL